MLCGGLGCSARCYSSCQRFRRRKELRVAIFARFSAVVVGLANFAVIAGWNGDTFLWWMDLTWTEALPSALLVVAVGLLTSEVVLRKLRPFRESFSDRYGIMVAALCLGGTLTGFFLTFLFAIDGTLGAEVNITLETMPYMMIGGSRSGLVGAMFGFWLGIAEGLILAFPLAAILGLFVPRDGSPRGTATPAASSH